MGAYEEGYQAGHWGTRVCVDNASYQAEYDRGFADAQAGPEPAPYWQPPNVPIEWDPGPTSTIGPSEGGQPWAPDELPAEWSESHVDPENWRDLLNPDGDAAD